MKRRSFFPLAASTPFLGAAAQAAPGQGRLKQSVSKWCFKNYSLEELCRESKRIGLVGIDLVGPDEWPTIQKFGLVPTMGSVRGERTGPLNRKENADAIVKKYQAGLKVAAAAKVPNVIIMSGNREGMSDEEGADNCVAALKRIAPAAEDAGVTVCLELLNSKVNHPDYMCDHTSWGVDVMKRVGSPRVKLLYDIYHMQIMEGDIIRTIRDNYDYIGHFHTGGNPGRHEIDDTQESNYKGISRAIADLGYDGYFAHEFIPAGPDPIKSLEQAFEICKV